MSDFVSRDEVYIAIALTSFISDPDYANGKVLLYEEDLKHRIDELQSARLDVNNSGLVSRRDVTNAIEETDWYHINKKGEMVKGSPSEMEAWYKYADIMDAVGSVPSADAVEVVRCKDCIHYESDDTGDMMVCNVTDTVCDNDDYCSYGERREDGEA